MNSGERSASRSTRSVAAMLSSLAKGNANPSESASSGTVHTEHVARAQTAAHPEAVSVPTNTAVLADVTRPPPVPPPPPSQQPQSQRTGTNGAAVPVPLISALAAEAVVPTMPPADAQPSAIPAGAGMGVEAATATPGYRTQAAGMPPYRELAVPLATAGDHAVQHIPAHLFAGATLEVIREHVDAAAYATQASPYAPEFANYVITERHLALPITAAELRRRLTVTKASTATAEALGLSPLHFARDLRAGFRNQGCTILCKDGGLDLRAKFVDGWFLAALHPAAEIMRSLADWIKDPSPKGPGTVSARFYALPAVVQGALLAQGHVRTKPPMISSSLRAPTKATARAIAGGALSSNAIAALINDVAAAAPSAALPNGKRGPTPRDSPQDDPSSEDIGADSMSDQQSTGRRKRHESLAAAAAAAAARAQEAETHTDAVASHAPQRIAFPAQVHDATLVSAAAAPLSTAAPASAPASQTNSSVVDAHASQASLQTVPSPTTRHSMHAREVEPLAASTLQPPAHPRGIAASAARPASAPRTLLDALSVYATSDVDNANAADLSLSVLTAIRDQTGTLLRRLPRYDVSVETICAVGAVPSATGDYLRYARRLLARLVYSPDFEAHIQPDANDPFARLILCVLHALASNVVRLS